MSEAVLRIEVSPDARFRQAFTTVSILLALIVYGLVLRPLAFDQAALPLEIIFILATAGSVGYLMAKGHSWDDIFDHIIKKQSQALPAILILLCIGGLIASWMVSGTIPMLIYYGIKIINPDYIYVLAFLIPVVFSMLTGTSWGSAGTIGVVIIGVAMTIDAHLPLIAGAIIGGSYFGDKLSPLSDTTNLSALGAGVDLYDHVRSMMYTTVPSATLAVILYYVVGLFFPVMHVEADTPAIQETLLGFEQSFNFNIALLLPPLIVLFGAITRKPSLIVLIASIIIAGILAFAFQDFTLDQVIMSVQNGFDASMITWAENLPENVVTIVNRGGLYSMSGAVVISILVFAYIGAVSTIQAIPTVVGKVLKSVKTQRQVVYASLATTSMTSAMTTNQYATAFMIGDAFSEKFEKLGLSRRVLSRALEDGGTMIESLVPWTPTAVFMAATLGVSYGEYMQFSFFPIINLILAYVFVTIGWAMFKAEPKPDQT